MAIFEPEPEPSRGLSIPRAAIAVLIVIGFGIGMFVGWMSSSESDPAAGAAPGQQAAATIMHNPAPLITNMAPLSEAGEPPATDLVTDRAVASETPSPSPPLQQAALPSALPNPVPPAKPVAPPPALPIQQISAPSVPEPPKPMPVVSAAATASPPPRAPSKPRAVPTAHEAPAESSSGSGPWVVQLGMFRVEGHAKELLAEAAGHGIPAEIANEPDASGEARFCVRTGHYPSREAALAAAHDLAKRDGFDTYVLKPHSAGAE